MDNFQAAAYAEEVKRRKDFIEANPDLSVDQLAAKFGVHPGTVKEYIKSIDKRNDCYVKGKPSRR